MSAGWPPRPGPVVGGTLPPQAARTPVKVLHVITRFIDGAGGNTLLTVLGTDRERYEVWVAGAEGGALWDQAERHGVRTVRLRTFRADLAPVDDARVLWDLVSLMRRERFAIVHTHSSKAGFLGRLAAWITRTPVVVHTIHGFAFHDFMAPGRRRFYIALERLVRPMTHAFLAVAPEVARQAVEMRLARPGTVQVVPSAIDPASIAAASDPSVRRELGVPDGVPLVGTVGRFDRQKGPLHFVRMAARVAAARPETRFVMVGVGPLLDECRAEAARLGVAVSFTGFRKDAARIAGAVDVYVVPSLYEGLGRALTEAMATGRPVAATAVNGVVDLVEPGATGLLSPPGAPDALAANVLWLLEHPAEARAMGAAGRDRARALCDPALMCSLVEATYERLLGRPRAGPAAADGPAGS